MWMLPWWRWRIDVEKSIAGTGSAGAWAAKSNLVANLIRRCRTHGGAGRARKHVLTVSSNFTSHFGDDNYHSPLP